jgi:hypothetical protein
MSEFDEGREEDEFKPSWIPSLVFPSLLGFSMDVDPLILRPVTRKARESELHDQVDDRKNADHELTFSNSFTTVSVGSAPFANHHLILSTFQTIFFSGTTPSTGPFAYSAFIENESKLGLNSVEREREGSRGMGSYSPSFSMGRASLRFRALIATCRGAFWVDQFEVA